MEVDSSLHTPVRWCVLPAIVVLVSALVLIGWAKDIVVLRNVLPQFTPMNPVTASLFFITGIVLIIENLFLVEWRRFPTRIAGILCLGVGIGMLLFYTNSIDLHIDRILFTTKLGINRMALATCINFTLLGICLLAHPRLKALMRVACAIIGLLSVYAFAAYLYNFIGIYGQAAFNPMAIHTAFLFLTTAAYFFLEEYRSPEFTLRIGSTGLMIFAIMVVGVLVSSYSYSHAKSALATNLYHDAEALSTRISVDDVSMLTGKETDLDLPAYQRIKEILRSVPEDSTDLRFAYLMGKNANDTVFFYVDSENPSSPDYSPPGQVYYEASPELSSLWATPKTAMEGPRSDRWGIWVSAFVPIVDTNHATRAILGVDIDAHEYIRILVLHTGIPLLVAALLSGILFIARRRTRHIILPPTLV